MRVVILAAVSAMFAAPAGADTFCDQLKKLETAGAETPRFASLAGETLVDPFGGQSYTVGTLEPQGLANCLIQTETRVPQKRYECTGPDDLSATLLKATFNRAAAGVEKCFGVKGEKVTETDYTLITYHLGKDDGRMVELGMSDGSFSLTYYPKPG